MKKSKTSDWGFRKRNGDRRQESGQVARWLMCPSRFSLLPPHSSAPGKLAAWTASVSVRLLVEFDHWQASQGDRGPQGGKVRTDSPRSLN